MWMRCLLAGQRASEGAPAWGFAERAGQGMSKLQGQSFPLVFQSHRIQQVTTASGSLLFLTIVSVHDRGFTDTVCLHIQSRCMRQANEIRHLKCAQSLCKAKFQLAHWSTKRIPQIQCCAQTVSDSRQRFFDLPLYQCSDCMLLHQKILLD